MKCENCARLNKILNLRNIKYKQIDLSNSFVLYLTMTCQMNASAPSAGRGGYGG